MKGRASFGLVPSAMLLLLVAGSGLAGGPRAAGVNASSPASAPWFIETVDPGANVGQHVSVAIDAQGTT